jgi:hypothetical protein
MAKRRKFRAEFKAEVVLQVLNGVKSQTEVCREHQLNSQLSGAWKRQFVENAWTMVVSGACSSWSGGLFVLCRIDHSCPGITPGEQSSDGSGNAGSYCRRSGSRVS